MVTDVKELNKRINDWVVKNNIEYTEMYHNVLLFYELAELLKNSLTDVENLKDIDIDFKSITKKDIFERIDIINQYYKNNNIDVDIDKLIDDGTIDFGYHNSDDTENCYHIGGFNGYKDNHKIIDCCNNGVITDAAILVHELSHYRNQPDGHRTQTNDMLTEALAMSEEQIFLDYLISLGYEKDVKEFRKIINSSAKDLAEKTAILFKFGYIFKTFSDVSKKSYKMVWDDNEYEEGMAKLLGLIEHRNINLLDEAWYVLGYLFSYYMCCKYRENNSFINKIQQLHQAISEKNVLECLKIIDLKNLGADDKEILGNSTLEMTKDNSKKRLS